MVRRRTHFIVSRAINVGKALRCKSRIDGWQGKWCALWRVKNDPLLTILSHFSPLSYSPPSLVLLWRNLPDEDRSPLPTLMETRYTCAPVASHFCLNSIPPLTTPFPAHRVPALPTLPLSSSLDSDCNLKAPLHEMKVFNDSIFF